MIGHTLQPLETMAEMIVKTRKETKCKGGTRINLKYEDSLSKKCLEMRLNKGYIKEAISMAEMPWPH